MILWQILPHRHKWDITESIPERLPGKEYKQEGKCLLCNKVIIIYTTYSDIIITNEGLFTSPEFKINVERK